MSCTRCGACCTSFGVCIMPSDIARISLATGMRPSEFVDTVQDYPGRERTEPALLISGKMKILVLKRSPSNVCTFYSHEGCRIYPHRPLLCRTYPFKKNMQNMLSRACPSDWAPAGSEKERYAHDILLYEKELAEFRKFAEEWNSKGGGSLKELLALIQKP